VVDTRFALIPGIDPTSDFTVEVCDYSYVVTASGVTTSYATGAMDPPCPVGSTCTVSNTAFPTFTHQCAFSKGGQFVDAQLFITCGTHYTGYDASNVVTLVYDYGYGTTRVHH